VKPESSLAPTRASSHPTLGFKMEFGLETTQDLKTADKRTKPNKN
jgi:hypothetical protein